MNANASVSAILSEKHGIWDEEFPVPRDFIDLAVQIPFRRGHSTTALSER